MHLLMLGIIRGGGIACPMNGNFVAANVEPYLLNIGARILFADVQTLFRVLGDGGGIGDVQDLVLTACRGDIPDISFDALRTAMHARHPRVSIHCIEDLLGAVDREHVAVERGARDPLYSCTPRGPPAFRKRSCSATEHRHTRCAVGCVTCTCRDAAIADTSPCRTIIRR